MADFISGDPEMKMIEYLVCENCEAEYKAPVDFTSITAIKNRICNDCFDEHIDTMCADSIARIERKT